MRSFVVRLACALAAVTMVDGYTAYSVCDRFNPNVCEPGLPNVFKGNLRVAVAQTTSNSTTSLEENVAKMAEWVKMAGSQHHARVILFPELSTTGYFAASVAALAEGGSAKVANARLMKAEATIAAACKEAQIYAIIGTPVFFADINATDERCDGQDPKQAHNCRVGNHSAVTTCGNVT